MIRRDLFRLVAGVLVAPEELVLPRKSIFLPPAGGWAPPSGSILIMTKWHKEGFYTWEFKRGSDTATVTFDKQGRALFVPINFKIIEG